MEIKKPPRLLILEVFIKSRLNDDRRGVARVENLSDDTPEDWIELRMIGKRI